MRDIIVVAVPASDELYALDPTNPAREIVRLKSSGPKPRLQPFASLQYASSMARLVYFSSVDEGTVYTIAPTRERGEAIKEWNWRAHPPTAGTLSPIADAAASSRFGVNRAHVFGRFRVAAMAGVDVAILVRHVDSPVSTHGG